MIKYRVGVVFMVISVFIVILICDLITPWLYRHVETDHYRTILLLEKLRDPDFKPDLMILGSSISMSGIDAAHMSNELGVDCYNFSSSNQSPEEGSLFFSELPTSLKVLIMVVFPPVKDVEDSVDIKVLPSNVCTAFAFGGYKLGDEIEQLNEDSDLSGLKKSKFLLNMDARGSIIIPGLYNYIRPKLDAGTKDFKYPYSYTEERLPTYEQSVAELRKRSHIGKEIEWDQNTIKTLNNYNAYLNSKGIDFIVAMLPTNPDIKEFSEEQLYWINTGFPSQLPGVKVLNYLSHKTNEDMYFDAIHLNRTGGKYVTSLFVVDLKQAFNMNIN
jgi:hypothetical protein